MDRLAQSRAVARAALAGRVDQLARDLSRTPPARLAHIVDDIRRAANDHQLGTLAALASGLERAMAASPGATVVLPYLEAMGDALEYDDMPPAMQAALLASVGVRLHG